MGRKIAIPKAGIFNNGALSLYYHTYYCFHRAKDAAFLDTTKGITNSHRISFEGLKKGTYWLVRPAGADKQVLAFVIR